MRRRSPKRPAVRERHGVGRVDIRTSAPLTTAMYREYHVPRAMRPYVLCIWEHSGEDAPDGAQMRRVLPV